MDVPFLKHKVKERMKADKNILSVKNHSPFLNKELLQVSNAHNKKTRLTPIHANRDFSDDRNSSGEKADDRVYT